jgi:uncharacterized protein YdeI (YjbR/CyaY-like superfamily)
MSKPNPKVNVFLSKARKWQEEFKKLSMIVLDCQLTEELKWSVPYYTYQKRNIVLMHGFKEYYFYFSTPKLSKTREVKVEKYMQKILTGRGLNDKHIR